MNWKDKLTDEMLEQVGTVMKAMSDTTKDHSHCWKSKTPPCGQKIEHLKCCLCEKLNPKVQSTLREELEVLKEKTERLKLEMDVVICDCGEPYKDSDAATLVEELNNIIQERIKELK